jgi:alpha-beta hydrolase superfamily lysophospholipase
VAKKKPKSRFKKVAIIGGLMLTILGAAATVFYLWPLSDTQLQQAQASPLNYAEAIAAHQKETQESNTLGLQQDCQSQLLTHGRQTQKAVVMLHGYVSCPKQFIALGQYFFERGYNVYIPRMPDHGLARPPSEKFTSYDLVTHASKAVDVAAGLGSEVGVVGLSGGGVLGTWLAHYRHEVERLLVLSPFYEPAAESLPKWQIKPFLLLYGTGLLADRTAENNQDLHYRSLAQFVRIRFSYKDEPLNPRLMTVGSVAAAGDREIDHQLAKSIPEDLATVNDLPLLYHQPPAEWNLGHDIVQAEGNADIGGRAAELYPIYLTMYEGGQP